jgi:hypothetical protein
MTRSEAIAKHRREIVLGLVLLALVVVFLYLRAGGAVAAGGEEAEFVTGPPGAVAKTLSTLASVKLPDVMLERLQDPPIRYDPTQRNIFRFGNMPPPPPSPEELARIEEARRAAEAARQAALQEEQRRQAELLAEQQAQQAAQQPPIDPATGLPVGMIPPPPARPAPPAVTLRYSGYVGAERNKLAVLFSGEDLVLARVGDTVDRQFRVLDIGYDWVKIGYVDPQFADEYQKLRMGP